MIHSSIKVVYRALSLLLFISCSSDDLTLPENGDIEATEHTAIFEDAEGQACCVIGVEEITPNTQETYEYTSNFDSTEISWLVVSGSMELLEGENDKTIILSFASDFTKGILEGKGQNNSVGCAEQIIISKK